MGRPLGGELAADDCLLEYHGVIDMCPSIRVLDGEVVPDISFGVAAIDIPLGEAEVDIIFGVASGVRRWLMCEDRAYFWTGGFGASLVVLPTSTDPFIRFVVEWLIYPSPQDDVLDDTDRSHVVMSTISCGDVLSSRSDCIRCLLNDSSFCKSRASFLDVCEIGRAHV